MDLQKHLEESGYTKAFEELTEFKRVRDELAAGILLATPEKAVEMQRDLDELNERIPVGEAALADEYAKAIKYVDFRNDLEFDLEQCEEIAELVAEELDKIDPKAGDHARALMRGERPTPPKLGESSH